MFSNVTSSFRTFQDAGDPNSVVLIVETDSIEKLAEVMNDPKHAGLKAKHTVIEPITISMEVTV